MAETWASVTVSNQAEADELIPELLEYPAVKREIKIVGMTGLIDLEPYLATWIFECDRCGASGATPFEPFNPCGCEPPEGHKDEGDCEGELTKHKATNIHRVTLTGGETEMHPNWVRSIRDQCAAAGVDFVLESWGDWVPEGQESPGYEWQPVSFRRIDLSGRDVKGLPGLYEESDSLVRKVGRDRSGRTLDGRTWPETIEVAK